MTKMPDKNQLLLEINDYISNISFLFDKIDVLTEDISFDLYEKNKSFSSEDILRILQVKHDIFSECITEIKKIIPKLSESALRTYNILKEL